ncbi:hypothetical protein DOY81_004808, partial [Sarcophaga bullata]
MACVKAIKLTNNVQQMKLAMFLDHQKINTIYSYCLCEPLK